jgi:hypothetical protein
MTETKREALKRIGYLALGCFIIFLIWKETGPLRFIGFIALLFIFYQMICLIFSAQQIIDEFFPPKIYYDNNPNSIDRSITKIAYSIFFAGLGILFFEERNIDNTIMGLDLFWKSSLSGLLLGVVIIVLLYLFWPSIFFESNRRIVIYSALPIGLMLLIPSVCSMLNRYNSEGKIQCVNFKIKGKSQKGSESASSYVYIVVNDNEEQFQISNKLYEQLQEREYIQLCLKNGFLGYPFVDEFKLSEES